MGNSVEIQKAVTPGWFHIVGTLTFSNVSQLREQGQQLMQPFSTITFDLSGIERSDSAGLALLIALLRFAHHQQKTLHFVNLPEQLLDLARLSNLEKILITSSDSCSTL